MNLETRRAVPPPIPEDAKRKGPPPIPESARKKTGGPPPIPEAARKASIEKARQQREQMELTERDVVEAFEISGFNGLTVTATMEKKDERKGQKDNHNEDNIIADPATGLIGVLDGLGGEGKGDLASKAAERLIVEEYEKCLAEVTKLQGADVQNRLVESQLNKLNLPELRQHMTEAVENILLTDPKLAKKALALVEALAKANEGVKETGGKTTACIGFVHATPQGERYAVVANVGDSAAFKRRASGEWLPIETLEDSLLNELIKNKTLTQDVLDKMKASPDEKIFLNERFSYKDLKRSMTASLGSSQNLSSLGIRRLDPGDTLVLGTDGLVDKFDTEADVVDYPAMADAYKGKTTQERLNSLRKNAKLRETYKTDDDIAIVTARVN